MIGVDRLLGLIAGVERTAAALDIARAMAPDGTDPAPARPPSAGSRPVATVAGAGVASPDLDGAAIDHAPGSFGGPGAFPRAHGAAATLLGLRAPATAVEAPAAGEADGAGATPPRPGDPPAARSADRGQPLHTEARRPTSAMEADAAAAMPGARAGDLEGPNGPKGTPRTAAPLDPTGDGRSRQAETDGAARAAIMGQEAGPEPAATLRAGTERFGEAALAPAGPHDLQPERAGVIASFILNAAMIPGWPPVRRFEPVATAAPPLAPAPPRTGAPTEGDFLRYVAAMGVLRAVLGEIEQALRSVRRRLRLLMALAILLTRIKLALAALAEEQAHLDEDDREAGALGPRRWTG